MNHLWECLSTVCALGLGFRDFVSASSLLLNESQALADFQYLHCVLHPDSKLHQWPDSSGFLSAVRHCRVPLFALQQRVPTLGIQLHCSVCPWQQGNAGNASLTQHGAGCVHQSVHPAHPGVFQSCLLTWH